MMRFMKMAAAVMVMAASSASWAAAPDATQVKAVQDMLVSLQAEKMMRQTAGASRYSSEAQRTAVFAKLDKVPPAVIYQRLAAPVAKHVSTETATEVARFYGTSYGQKLLQAAYNSGPSMYGAQDPKATPAEKAELKKPSVIKARKALAEADQAIRHETFVLLQQIVK